MPFKSANYDTSSATTPSTMTPLTSFVCCHYPLYYDVTTPSTMTSLPPILWRHYPLYFDATNLSTMISLPFYYDGTNPSYYDVTNPSTITSLIPLLYVTNAVNYTQVVTSECNTESWRHCASEVGGKGGRGEGSRSFKDSRKGKERYENFFF